MPNLTYNFTDKVVLVTGGAAGIGFQLTSSFLKAGAKVVVWDYSTEAIHTSRKRACELFKPLKPVSSGRHEKRFYCKGRFFIALERGCPH